MWFERGRGQIYLRESSYGVVVLSWFPNEQSDPDWPGFVVEISQTTDFPTEAALRGDRVATELWLNRQPWAQPGG
jgi:hypothetical protein